MQSTTIEGYSVVMYPGICHVSKGYHFATLEYVREHMCLRDNRGVGLTVSPHQLLLIKQWATAHGYIKERRRAKTTPYSFTDAGRNAGAGIVYGQLALSLEASAARPRRRARTG